MANKVHREYAAGRCRVVKEGLLEDAAAVHAQSWCFTAGKEQEEGGLMINNMMLMEKNG